MEVDSTPFEEDSAGPRAFYMHRYVHYVEPAYVPSRQHPAIHSTCARVPFGRQDTRTRTERIVAREAAWASIMPEVVDGYIAWCNGRAAGSTNSAPPSNRDDSNEQPCTSWWDVDVLREYGTPRCHRIRT